ncbi:VWA domain-containing protein [Bifidobacterium thermophilum]|uniref:VWA domain-containing protein n=1 Tax=Bifidobacterium thermophilum TaxID=33905 RepID=UPI00309E11BE
MSTWTLSPALGWPAGCAIATAMAVCAVAGIVIHLRTHGSSDETVGSCIRRTLICLLVALAALTPSTVATTTSKAVNATDIVIAVDTTSSMAVKDAAYGDSGTISRLDAATRVVHDLTKAYPAASFSALRFGASASLDVPLTPDTLAIDNWADSLSVEPTSASSGSSLDTPLDKLLLTLKDIRQRHTDDTIVLVLISDGEQTSTTTRRTYSSLRRYVTDALVMGTGSAAGGNIPADGSDDGAGETWVTDPATGQPGVSKLDKDTLDTIADELGGTAIMLDAGHTVTNALPAASKQWRTGTTAKTRQRATPVVWPIAIALCTLLAWELGAWIGLSRRLL